MSDQAERLQDAATKLEQELIATGTRFTDREAEYLIMSPVYRWLRSKAVELEAERDALHKRVQELESALRTIDRTLTGTLPVTSQVKEMARAALKGE